MPPRGADVYFAAPPVSLSLTARELELDERWKGDVKAVDRRKGLEDIEEGDDAGGATAFDWIGGAEGGCTEVGLPPGVRVRANGDLEDVGRDAEGPRCDALLLATEEGRELVGVCAGESPVVGSSAAFWSGIDNDGSKVLPRVLRPAGDSREDASSPNSPNTSPTTSPSSLPTQESPPSKGARRTEPSLADHGAFPLSL